MYKHFFIFLALVILNGSCIEEYTPDVSRNERLLIVDGGITNTDGPHTVTLKISGGINDPATESVVDARVTMEEKNGKSVELTGLGQGRYRTAIGELQGKPGTEYRLLVTWKEEQYESDWMLIKEGPMLDSVYWQRETKEGIDMDLDGIRIYLDTHDPNNNTRYYRWEFREDWAFSVPISSSWNPSVCYSSSTSSGILIGSTEKLKQDRLIGQPVTFIDQTTTRLTLRYRIIITQHAITEKEHTYWESMEDLNENLGTLFDPIPARINGNIRNITNPGREVLGFFTASSVLRDTMYVDNFDLEQDPIYFESPYSFCTWISIAGEGAEAKATIARYRRIGWSIADTMRDGLVLITTMANSQFCFDCTTAGSKDPPEDWIPFSYH